MEGDKKSNFIPFKPTLYCCLLRPLSTFLKWGIPRRLLRLFLSFQTNITIFTTNKCEKMSIQYMVLGFEPTTFVT